MAQIAVKNVINATVRMDNSDDTVRKYVISADVTFSDGRLDRVENGSAVSATGEAGSTSFHYYYYGNQTPQSLNLNYDGYADLASRMAVTEAIDSFVASTAGAVPTFSVFAPVAVEE